MRPFPVDDISLGTLEEALDCSLDYDPVKEELFITGEFSVPQLLEFLSGPSNYTEDGDLTVRHEPIYSEHDVIRALIAEVRKLRRGTVEYDTRITSVRHEPRR